MWDYYCNDLDDILDLAQTKNRSKIPPLGPKEDYEYLITNNLILNRYEFASLCGIINNNQVIVNCDEDNNSLVVDYLADKFCPSFSFRCLARFFKINPLLYVDFKKFYQNLNIKIVDWYKSERQQSILVGNHYRYKNLGFTIVNTYEMYGKVYYDLHKSGFTLVNIGKRYFILGQDDNQYFGSELPEPAKTIKQALKILQPKGITGNFQRQGEWFFIPTNITNIDESDYIYSIAEEIILPKENIQSGEHLLKGSIFINCKTGEILVKKFTCHHSEHTTLYAANKHCFYKVLRNRAVCSFSAQGVD